MPNFFAGPDGNLYVAMEEEYQVSCINLMCMTWIALIKHTTIPINKVSPWSGCKSHINRQLTGVQCHSQDLRHLPLGHRQGSVMVAKLDEQGAEQACPRCPVEQWQSYNVRPGSEL